MDGQAGLPADTLRGQNKCCLPTFRSSGNPSTGQRPTPAKRRQKPKEDSSMQSLGLQVWAA